MSERADSEAASATQSAAATAPEATTPAPSASPLPVAAPAIALAAEAAKIDKIELSGLQSTRIEPPKVEPIARPIVAAAIASASAAAQAGPWTRLRSHAPLAASLAVAALLGAAAGAAASGAFTREAPLPATTIAPADEQSRALKETVVRLGTELATLKASIDAANRNSAAQLNKLAERFDRAEKAQTEPATRLARIAESLDRLERRAATTPATTVAAAPEVTGSVTVMEKQLGKPPVADGWRLREYFAGRAVVESRHGGIYEIGPGSNLPGLGKVESIKREDGRVVVTTPKGIIVSHFDPRRPLPYQPYRY